MLQLKGLFVVTGGQTPETAPPQQSTTNRQSQSQSQHNGPDLSKLSPRLQQQFDHDQNAHLGNIVIAKFSTIPVAWSCNQCPSGYIHKWVQKPHSRTVTDGCPFCSGKRACKHNSLASKSHAAAASWDYSANEGTPDDYTAGSHYRATWNCQDCGLSWQTRIKQRALEGTGCPHCYKLRRGRKADGSRTSHPTLRGPSGDHPLMAEWDTDANEKAGLRPENIKLRSHIHVNWICRRCPLGLLHLYKAMPLHRTRRSGSYFLASEPFVWVATGALFTAPCHLFVAEFCNDNLSQVRILDMIKLLLQTGAQLAEIWSILLWLWL